MKIAAILVLAALAAPMPGSSPAQAQQPSCPNGAYPSLDDFGNQVCKRLADGGVATVRTPRGQPCPNGAYPTMDNYGNPVCRTEASGTRPRTDYYDTSKGCPIGTYPTVDKYGANVCKRF